MTKWFGWSIKDYVIMIVFTTTAIMSFGMIFILFLENWRVEELVWGIPLTILFAVIAVMLYPTYKKLLDKSGKIREDYIRNKARLDEEGRMQARQRKFKEK